MIGYFCDPFPEETLHSALARWCALLRLPNQKLAVRQLFGTVNAQAVVDLPCHLDALLAALPPQHGYTADRLIDAHTLLPFYSPFSAAKRVKRLRGAMRDDGKAIHMSIGLMAGRIRPPRWLRSCPECDREDTMRYGEPYWHRLHQLAGVEVCPIHNVFLENSTARRLNPQTRHAFHSARLTQRADTVRAVNRADRVHRMLLALAHDAAWLLTQSSEPLGQKAIYARYKVLLTGQDFTTGSGRVRWKRLREDFESHYPERLLRQVQCELSDSGEHNWLARLVRSPRAVQSPLRHLLLIHFLGHTAESFFQNIRQPGIFGTGPWPCLNRVCTRYKRPVIKACLLEHNADRSQPIGVFRCPVCSQIYCRVGCRDNAVDCSTADWIREYGSLWLAKLDGWWKEPRLSLREISRRLGTDPMTIKRYAARMGLPFPRMGKRLTNNCSKPLHDKNCKNAIIIAMQQRRDNWLEAMAEEPTFGVKRLRMRLPALYTQLYRHDREWLRANQPTRKLAPSRPNCRVDWQERDARLAQLIPGAATRIREAGSGRPRQITLPSVGKELGHLALLEKCLKNLPLTAQAVAAVTETRSEFALRRIRWATSRCCEDGVCPARWQLIRRAGLRPEVAHEPMIASFLDQSLRNLVIGNLTKDDLILPSSESAA